MAEEKALNPLLELMKTGNGRYGLSSPPHRKENPLYTEHISPSDPNRRIITRRPDGSHRTKHEEADRPVCPERPYTY